MGQIFGRAAPSELDIWLADSQLFDQFLTRNNVIIRVAASLKKQDPRLEVFAHSVSITPRFTDSLTDISELGIEAEYATIEEDTQVVRRRINRISVNASADTAEGSRVAAKTAMVVLQKTMEDAATRRIREQRKLVEKYIRLGEKRITKAEAFLNKKAIHRLYAAKDENARLAELEGVCRHLQGEIADLNHQIASESENVIFTAIPTVTADREAELAREQRMAERLYKPDSPHYEIAERRLRTARLLARQLQQEATQKSIQSLKQQLSVKQTLLEKATAEYRGFARQQLSPQARNNLALAEKELSGWLDELTSWQRQLLTARIQEQLCKADGTVLALQEPLLGKRSWIDTETLGTRYAKTFKFLPLAPLGAFVLVVLFHLGKEVSRVPYRMETYCEAPVLAELPALPKIHRKIWRHHKVTGSWDGESNGRRQ